MKYVQARVITAAVVLTAIVCAFSVELHTTRVRHEEAVQSWNTRIDRAGLRRAGLQKTIAYLRSEHLICRIYHEDQSLIIVDLKPDYWFTLSAGFHQVPQKLWISFDDNHEIVDCSIIPIIDHQHDLSPNTFAI